MNVNHSNGNDSVIHANVFDLKHTLHELKHYLPAQAPLKDFVHHNTLHAFQQAKFFDSLRKASKTFGYRVTLPLDEFRAKFIRKEINETILDKIIIESKGEKEFDFWKNNILNKVYDTSVEERIGGLRAHWNSRFHFDIDTKVHPIFFRIICSYLDQGISVWDFPIQEKGFLASIRELERVSYTSFFKTKRAKNLIKNHDLRIEELLSIVVGDSTLYEQYLFDQQFSHQGWSGMISSIEDFPSSLINSKKITLEEAIKFELLLEIDALDDHFGESIWSPIGSGVKMEPIDLLADVPSNELSEVIKIWQEAFEWSYYDQVLAGIKLKQVNKSDEFVEKSFQAMFCIDDRECSIRRYVEKQDPCAETFGTPGFFSVEFYFQPDGGQHYTKLCPAPVTPKFLIKEVGGKGKKEKDVFYSKQANSLVRGWFVSQLLGFWAAIKLIVTIFKPSSNAANASSYKHMEQLSKLTILNNNESENGLQIGFTIIEMTDRMEGLLKSIGMVKDFASIVYIVGHGASSANNPHYSAYDCGACCGRPGSVNARVAASMLNNELVREQLKLRGVLIPVTTQFIGALHDTTRDEIRFYDVDSLNESNKRKHIKTEETFKIALDNNAKERSRRFESINSKLSASKIHRKIEERSIALFEPRPELNHATNSLCIVGRRELSNHLFLDRRSFLNSFDYRVDPEGKYLFNILKAAAPVCGGINLEYFFSRVDNQKLGAGSKLPHNVMGLIGVANGYDGDLRPGLPGQMIEVHDPVRLLIIVEHFPEVVLNVIKSNDATYEWFKNEWINLVVVNPETHQHFVFQNENFAPYIPITKQLEKVKTFESIIESKVENLPVYLIAE